jgi:hypothetical protein
VETDPDWIGFWATVVVVAALALAISQWDVGARLVWGGLVVAIVVVLLRNSSRVLDLANTLSGGRTT